jgi:uroporphyrinogen decarboxylase
MLETGAWGYHFGNKIDMVEVLNECPPDVLVFGNLDPVNVFKLADPEVVKTTTLELLNATSGYSNFVLSSGCDIPPHTSHSNIKAFYEALEEYNNLQ